jgi:DNA invertase Pin-like site-specific DNA recombinase
MANVGYVRVSTKEQNTGRQFADFEKKGIKLDKTFTEKISGKDTNRPELKAMLAYVREGDTVYIESISRLARNVKDFLNIFEELQGKSVNLVSLKEKIDTTSAYGKFMINVFASLAQLERDVIKERQREGIDLALKEGRQFGRPTVTMSKTFKETYKLVKAGKITAVEAMKREGLKKTTFYKLVKELEK